ncbi:S1C family serine protease [Sphingomonas asaccharolytica]|uniref:S1C family serine protease n=1 Tax=Sphingomonas asaccharolytica TaxID=40681 RepID=UPI000A0384CA|nr:trypsin-like peptidase domain-containing protein [Sphingomonas asaccharolytica]
MSATPPAMSFRKLAITAAVVLVLIVIGVVTGAQLWRPMATVERHVVAPIQRVTNRASPSEMLPDLVDTACPAVVRIGLGVPPASTAKPNLLASRGLAGIVVSSDGYIVTSGRMLAGRDTLPVQFNDGRELDAKLVASDPLSGLALVKVDGRNFTTLQFADADLPRTGAWGFSLTSPAGRGCAVQPGVIAQDFVAGGEALRSSISVGPTPSGNVEGVPFIGSDGRVLGLSVFPDDDSAGDLGVLVPGDVAARIVSEMLRSGAPPATPFGIVAEDLGPVLAKRLGADRQRGAVVVMVKPGSPADIAGLKAGDVVLTAGESPISGASELGRALDPDAPSIDLEMVRHGERQQLTLKS